MLKEICRQIAADEFRHFKLFYDHMRRYLGAREHRRAAPAAHRRRPVGESEDDELAFAFHCGNEPEGMPYRTTAASPPTWRARWRCTASAISSAAWTYLQGGRAEPRGRLSDFPARLAWRLMQRRQRRFAARSELPRAA